MKVITYQRAHQPSYRVTLCAEHAADPEQYLGQVSHGSHEGKCQDCEHERQRAQCQHRNGCEREGNEQYSLGIYAGRYCEPHWKVSGYRTEGASGFDPMDAGENYDEY